MFSVVSANNYRPTSFIPFLVFSPIVFHKICTQNPYCDLAKKIGHILERGASF
jgi:hypothetical protein